MNKLTKGILTSLALTFTGSAIAEQPNANFLTLLYEPESSKIARMMAAPRKVVVYSNDETLRTTIKNAVEKLKESGMSIGLDLQPDQNKNPRDAVISGFSGKRMAWKADLTSPNMSMEEMVKSTNLESTATIQIIHSFSVDYQIMLKNYNVALTRENATPVASI